MRRGRRFSSPPWSTPSHGAERLTARGGLHTDPRIGAHGQSTRAHPPGRGLPPLVPGRRRQGRAGRQRPGARARWSSGPTATRSGSGCRPRSTRRIKAAGAENAYFPLFIPESYLQPRGRARRGLQPRAGRRHPSPAARSSTSRSSCGPPARRSSASTWPSGCRATATCRCCSTSGPTSCAGSCARACSCAPASSSGRRATPRTPPTRTPRAYAAAHPPRGLRATSWSTCWPCRSCVGRKTAQERFAGAINTLTCEAMMRDGKALQMGTSHELGQNFASAFDIDYLDDAGRAADRAGPRRGASSTRMVGGLIMAHGDDAGPARAAAPRADPGASSWWSRTSDGVVRGRAPGSSTSSRRGRARRARRPRRHAASVAAPPTGSSRACRSASRSAPATSPRARSPWLAGSPAASRRSRSEPSSTW